MEIMQKRFLYSMIVRSLPCLTATVFALLFFLPVWSEAAEADTNVFEVIRARNRLRVDLWHRESLKKYEEDSDMLVLPGLVADREKKTVTVYAEATGLGQSGSPPEFFIISQKSGHDYESLLISFAEPGHVHTALEFIGMKPGRPVNPAELRFWPKGERVIIHAVYTNRAGKAESVRLSELLVDAETEKPPPEKGFVFTGSRMVQTRANGTVYAADVMEPRAIAANYNEPNSVLDIPRVAPQGSVYRTFVVNSEYVFPEGALIKLRFEPEYPGGKKRVKEMSLCVELMEGKGVRFRLSEDGKKIVETEKADKLIKSFRDISKAGHDPFVELSFGDSMRLEDIKSICASLSQIETPEGIRMEPPPEGHLYYKAFLPNEKFRNREKRSAQPWELHLSKTSKGNLSATLIEIDQVWKEQKVWPDLKIREHSIDDGEHLKSRLADLSDGDQLRVILVYADPALNYGKLLSYLLPVIDDYSTIHVFLKNRDGESIRE